MCGLNPRGGATGGAGGDGGAGGEGGGPGAGGGPADTLQRVQCALPVRGDNPSDPLRRMHALCSCATCHLIKSETCVAGSGHMCRVTIHHTM